MGILNLETFQPVTSVEDQIVSKLNQKLLINRKIHISLQFHNMLRTFGAHFIFRKVCFYNNKNCKNVSKYKIKLIQKCDLETVPQRADAQRKLISFFSI